jgi:hypothetical protein
MSTLTPQFDRLQSYIEGLPFPADKSHLIAHASLRGAPEDLLEFLESLPDKTYADLAQLEDEMSPAEPIFE